MTMLIKPSVIRYFPRHRAQFRRGLIIAIREENKGKWERRSPLSPSHVKQLISAGGGNNVKVIVQPSKKRVFTDSEYQSVSIFVSVIELNTRLVL
jgi:Alanine dehydrogenase/PNT, N-terminal domain